MVCELKLPPYHATPEAVAKYEKYGKRILWIDSNVVPGSFQMNSSWYFHPNKPEGEVVVDKNLPATQSHVHEDADEIVAFYGSDPEHPEELNGEIEFWIPLAAPIRSLWAMSCSSSKSFSCLKSKSS